jgi:hypothetical protein
VDVRIIDGLAAPRDEHAIEGVLRELAGLQHVLQPPDLEHRADEQAAAIGAEAGGPRIILLVEGEPAVRADARQDQLSGLVGGEGERDPVREQPAGQSGRDRDLRVVGIIVVRRLQRRRKLTKVRSHSPFSRRPLL